MSWRCGNRDSRQADACGEHLQRDGLGFRQPTQQIPQDTLDAVIDRRWSTMQVFATSLGRRRQCPPTSPTRALVTTGIHACSRNPIYVGLFLVYGGIGIAARSPWALILTLPLAITIRYGVVAREEAYLERRFGEAYRDYKARVRRWL